MGLDEYIPSEQSESGPKSSEISEKFKESIKKASAQIKKVQKDEKKAKKYDLILAGFLVEIIKDKKYDFLLQDLFKCLDNGYSSNFLIGILSLIYQPISDKIRELSKKEKFILNYNKTPDFIDFDDDKLDKNIKQKINIWIEDIIDISSIEYSNIQLQKLKELLKEKNSRKIISNFCSKLFIFFFDELNIALNKNKSDNYVDFILSQILLKLEEIKIEEI